MPILKYTNSRGDSITLGNTAPYFLSSIDGFSNIDNIITSYQSPYQDGVNIVNTKLSARPLTLTGEILHKDRQVARDYIIKVFNPKLTGTLQYTNGSTIKEIECIPDKTPVIKSSTKATMPYMINLLASDPYFRDLEDYSLDMGLWEDGLEFPLELISAGIELGTKSSATTISIDNLGHVSCGMIITMKAVGAVINPILTNTDTSEYIKINKTLATDEVITITTHYQNKKVILTSSGADFNIFSNLDYESTFLQLESGVNNLEYSADSGSANLEVTITYSPRYLGV